MFIAAMENSYQGSKLVKFFEDCLRAHEIDTLRALEKEAQ